MKEGVSIAMIRGIEWVMFLFMEIVLWFLEPDGWFRENFTRRRIIGLAGVAIFFFMLLTTAQLSAYNPPEGQTSVLLEILDTVGKGLIILYILVGLFINLAQILNKKGRLINLVSLACLVTFLLIFIIATVLPTSSAPDSSRLALVSVGAWYFTNVVFAGLDFLIGW